MRILFLAPLLALAAACGPAPEGQPCDITRKDACEEGSFCALDRNRAALCLPPCTETKDCPVDDTCTGISATGVKVCQTPGVD